MLLGLEPIWDEQRMVPYTKYSKRGKRRIKPCHLRLLPSIVEHIGLLEIRVNGGDRPLATNDPKRRK